MARLLSEQDRLKEVVVGINGGRILHGIVDAAGDDIVWLSAENKEHEMVSRIRQDMIAYVTFLIPKNTTTEVVPIQRKGKNGLYEPSGI